MMKIYNTLTRSVETFTPLTDNEVKMYTCGPTVYDRAHLGNMRTYILADILVRTLKFLGYDVTHVMNFTDIDDKTLNRAEQEGISLSELTERYETLFLEDLAKLHVELADIYARATEHFPEMKELINTLLDKGYAYEKEGEVYFSIEKFKEYGRLSRLDQRTIKTGARVAVDEYDKENANDFVLWKVDEVTRQHDHEATRAAGRPGWHIECSAMAMKYLGETIDIHLGGVDLIFPHHENEIAQSEAATGKEFVRYFVHGEHMSIEGQKMSKSLGNIYNVSDLEMHGVDPVAYRYLVLSAHYRSKLNFTWESLEGAARTLESIRQLAYRPVDLSDERRREVLEAATEALHDDLDIPRVLALLHDAGSYDLWLAFEPVLGLGLVEIDETAIPELITELVMKRQDAKAAKDFAAADALRIEIEQAGYMVEDTATGPRIVPR